MIDPNVLRIFIGRDPREAEAYEVCAHSIRRLASVPVHITPLKLADLSAGDRPLYRRAPDPRASTEFTYTRFLVPALADFRGWALYCDCDFLFLDDVDKLFAEARVRAAVMCVQHEHVPRVSHETIAAFEEMSALWRRTQAEPSILQELSRRLDERVAAVKPAISGTKEEGRVQELCRRVFAKGEDRQTAVRVVWGDKFSDASSELRRAIACALALPLLSPDAALLTKMDGIAQSTYPRKNWSSLMLFNCAHPSTKRLHVHAVNSATPSWLHQMQWAADAEIYPLREDWNWLAGVSPTTPHGYRATISAIHYTDGGPWFPEYADCEFAEEWRAERALMQAKAAA